MGFFIESGETIFKFNIIRIGNNNTHDYKDLDYWLIIEASVENRIFNYYHQNETLEYQDIILIRDSFNKLLSGETREQIEIGFTEPDFEFLLYPAISFSELKKPLEIWRTDEDICADFIINLTESDGAYNGERYIFPLNRKDITIWRDYLNEAIITFDARENPK
jgi:hypothetical protein